MTTGSILWPKAAPAPDADYDTLLANLQRRAAALAGPLFTIDTADLYHGFLGMLPDDLKQINTCSACRKFVNRYGRLVTVDEDGRTHSALWREEDAPGAYAGPVAMLRKMVESAPVSGVFYDKATTWGQPVTGPWHHLAARPSAALVFSRATKTAGQTMAEKREDCRTLCRALADFTPEVLSTAVALLRMEALYRSEKVLGMAEWLQQLHQRRAATKHTHYRENLTWLAVSTAPAGFCHPRSSMIGTLLEDIAAGLSFDEVSKRFAAKMHPLQYQRPQAPPKAGNIAEAEKVIGQLEAAGALKRRFARVEEIQALWRPRQPTPLAPNVAPGIFAHLLAEAQGKASKLSENLDVPATAITWAKFRETVLPHAEQIKLKIVYGPNTYAAMVTAAEPDAPPIIQWDRAERRNPFSWYLYHGGSQPSDWNLVAGDWANVTAITLQPNLWGEQPLAHQGLGVLFVLAGARDMRADRAGAGLFPEILKAEFHGIRSTIEAYSKRAAIADAEVASACGLMLQNSKDVTWHALVRVTMTGTTALFSLDRWD